MAGRWFEQFEVGQSFDHEIRRTVTNAGIVTFLHQGFNQRDEEVCTCLRQALMLRAPR